MAKRIIAFPTPTFDEPLTVALLGESIRAKRTQSQLRIEDAAAMCGVSKQTFMNLERGKGTTQLSLVFQVCAALGIQLKIAPWLSEQEATDEWQ